MSVTEIPSTTIHGVCLKIFDSGVLILGKSGVGKSECALDLIDRKHKLIADDSVTLIKTNDNIIVAESQSRFPFHMSIRGLGIINIQEIFGPDSVCPEHKMDLVIELSEGLSQNEYDLLGLTSKFHPILDVNLRYLKIPATPHKNLSTIIEVAVKNDQLKASGTNSAKIFHNNLLDKLHQRGKDSPLQKNSNVNS